MIKFGFSDDVIIRPLIYAIEKGLIKPPFQIKKLSADEVFSGLLENRLQAGFINPLQYAKSKDKLAIVKEIVVSTQQHGRNCLLFFQEDLRHINKVYFPQSIEDTFELFFAKLVLGEHFDIEAEWISLPTLPSIEDALEQYPVLLLAGIDAFKGLSLVENYIDLTEEWSLKTQLPLVHRILAIRRDLTDQDFLNSVRMARELGIRHLKKISIELSEEFHLPWGLFHDLFSEKYQYLPTQEIWDSLKEILQFIFYYGETEYYPEIHFHEKK